MRRSVWKWSRSSRRPLGLPRVAGDPEGGRKVAYARRAAAYVLLPFYVGLLALGPPASAQKGLPMTAERLDSLTQGRTMELRMRAESLTQVLPSVTQQMLYRTRLTPEAADLSLSVFCSGAHLSQFEHAITTLFGYRLFGRSQGEGMGLVFVPDTEAVARASRQRLQGRAAVEAGIQQAIAWIRQPAGLGEVARTRCPAAGSLRDAGVRRAFLMYAALSPKQRATVMAGHPVLLATASLPPALRSLLPAGAPAPRWLLFYLHANPWNPGDPLRLAVRAEPSGQTWLSCPPLDLVPAHYPVAGTLSPAFKTRLGGEPDLADLDPGEEAPALLEWMSDQSKVWIMAEAFPSNPGGAEQLKKLAASCRGLTLEEGLDRVAAYFGATWRYDDGWVLIQRRSTESLTARPAAAAVVVGRRG